MLGNLTCLIGDVKGRHHTSRCIFTYMNPTVKGHEDYHRTPGGVKGVKSTLQPFRWVFTLTNMLVQKCKITLRTYCTHNVDCKLNYNFILLQPVVGLFSTTGLPHGLAVGHLSSDLGGPNTLPDSPWSDNERKMHLQ